MFFVLRGVEQVKSIDVATNTIELNPSTPPVYGLKDNARFYAVNILAELDAPNEVCEPCVVAARVLTQCLMGVCTVLH